MSTHKWIDASQAGPEWARFRGKVCQLCGLAKFYDSVNGWRFVAVPPGGRKKRQVVVLEADGTYNRRVYGSRQPSCPWTDHPQVAFRNESGMWATPRKAKK